MVNVTDRAKTALKSALSRSVDEPGIGLRVEISDESSCALVPDRMKPGDQVVEHEGDVLLLIGHWNAPLDRRAADRQIAESLLHKSEHFISADLRLDELWLAPVQIEQLVLKSR